MKKFWCTKKGNFNLEGNIPSNPDERLSFIKGIFQNTVDLFLKNFNPKNQLVIHFDCDLYSSTFMFLRNSIII